MTFQSDPSPWCLEWSDKLSVFIPEIDAEHQYFIFLINELNDAIVMRMDAVEIMQCMQAVLKNTRAHFTHEEAMFREWGYPQAEEHAQMHAGVLQELHELMREFERGCQEHECIRAGLQVKQILVLHLLHEDMKYREYHCAQAKSATG